MWPDQLFRQGSSYSTDISKASSIAQAGQAQVASPQFSTSLLKPRCFTTHEVVQKGGQLLQSGLAHWVGAAILSLDKAYEGLFSFVVKSLFLIYWQLEMELLFSP